jgi:hypothetical protein
MKAKSILLASFAFVLSPVALAQVSQPIPVPAPVTGAWTSGKPADQAGGDSISQCPEVQEHVIGIQVEGSDANTKNCIGCVARLRVICSPLR